MNRFPHYLHEAPSTPTSPSRCALLSSKGESCSSHHTTYLWSFPPVRHLSRLHGKTVYADSVSILGSLPHSPITYGPGGHRSFFSSSAVLHHSVNLWTRPLAAKAFKLCVGRNLRAHIEAVFKRERSNRVYYSCLRLPGRVLQARANQPMRFSSSFLP